MSTRKHGPGRKATPITERLPRDVITPVQCPAPGQSPEFRESVAHVQAGRLAVPRVAELESVLCLIAAETHDCQPYSYADAVARLARIHGLAATPVGWTP